MHNVSTVKYRSKILIISLIITINASAESSDLGIKVTDISGFTSSSDTNFLNTPGTIKVLRWVKDSNKLCGGYYSEPISNIKNQTPTSFCDTPFDITASKPAFFTKSGTSIMQGDVKLIQPGREITADHITFFRDNKTGKINKSLLIGHVTLLEPNKIIVVEQGNLDFVNKIYILHNGVYRLLANTPTGLANIWGKTKYAISNTVGVLKLNRASYTTCPPDTTSWYLRGSKITIDQNTGRGDVVNAVLFLKKVPVLYTPYFNFPVDKNRKSGFLFPTINYSKSSGYSINTPYYLNLAPNYDATFSPYFFTKRGGLLGGSFRYLTTTSSGNINFDYIPHDSVFINFRNSTISSSFPPSDQHAIKELKDSSDSRGFLGLQNDSYFDEHWKSSLSVNYASDDYFIQDFGRITSQTEKDQLLNRADISYFDYNWSFLTRLQIFQTLHPITHKGAQDQYKKLPQLALSGDFPNGWKGLDYRFDSEIVNFTHRDDFYKETSTAITGGSRFNITPSISIPLGWLGGYIVPRIQLQTTGYNTHDQINAPNNIFCFHPLISVDSGIVLRRNINFLNKKYTQTLEPRFFYLLIPDRNQATVPIFDTYLPPFDFSQLFRTNRFSGIDRVGDANQIAIGIVTRFLDEYGQEKFNTGLGQIVAMHKHRVNIDATSSNANYVPYNIDPLEHEYLSPLVGKLQYFVHSKINITLNMAWDPNYHRLNTLDTNLQYIDGSDRVINLWYNYVLHGDQDPSTQNKGIDLSRAGISVGWKIWQHWNIIGSLTYNTSYGRTQNYLYGLEYNSCCWAMRMAHSKEFVGIGVDNKSNYDSRFYIQFLLKGFSNLEAGGLNEVLANQIKGYQNKLSSRY